MSGGEPGCVALGSGGSTGSGGGTDTLQRSLRTLGLVEVDAS